MESPSPAVAATPGVAPSPTPGAVGPVAPTPRLSFPGAPTVKPQLPPTRPVRANEPQPTTAPGVPPLRFGGAPQFSFPLSGATAMGQR